MEKVVIGLAIGGTTVKIGILTINGEILKNGKYPQIKNKMENI